MTDDGWRRVDAMMAMLGLILVGIALLLPGQPPRTSDAAEVLRRLLVNDRESFLAGQYIAGLGAIALIWFIPRLGTFLCQGSDDAQRLATASAVGLGVGVTLLLVGMAIFSGVALKAAGAADAILVRAAIDIGNELIGVSKFAFGAMVITGSLAGTRSGTIPRWLARFGFVAAGYTIISAAAVFSDDHRFEFGSPFELVGGVLPAVWVFMLSLVMFRRSAEATAPWQRRVPA